MTLIPPSTEHGTHTESPWVYHQKIPDGIIIKKVPFGYGLFATKFFPKGSVVYEGQQLVIPNEFARYRLILDNMDGKEFNLDTETHSVQKSRTQRWLYLFDAFMNHSCEPTTYSHAREDIETSGRYDTVALRDINPGDEITCDYCLFEYDCRGKTIHKCQCGSSACIGRVAGFKYLSRRQQEERVQLVDEEVLNAMSEDAANNTLYISVGDEGKPWPLIFAPRDLRKGDRIREVRSHTLPEDTCIIFDINGKRAITFNTSVAEQQKDPAGCALVVLSDIRQGEMITFGNVSIVHS